jgi:hypothetical protein
MERAGQGQGKKRTRTIHGLEAELLFLDVDEEHVLLVVLCVSGRLPQVQVVHVWRHNLLVLVLPVLLPYVLQAPPPRKPLRVTL